MTVKEILSENRDSIISSIKWHSKVYSKEDIKKEMVDFLNWSENHQDRIFEAYDSTKTKTLLKNCYITMVKQRTEEYNMSVYGKKRPNLRDVMTRSIERQEEAGNVWNPVAKRYEKREY